MSPGRTAGGCPGRQPAGHDRRADNLHYRKLDHELSLDEIAAGIQDVDLILVEGYKKSNRPSIEVVRLAKSAELVGSPEQRIAVASDQPLEVGVPWFHLDDIQRIAGFIEGQFLK
jgi:molybdopterin-guanine dinucleotide biosynthesis protein B